MWDPKKLSTWYSMLAPLSPEQQKPLLKQMQGQDPETCKQLKRMLAVDDDAPPPQTSGDGVHDHANTPAWAPGETIAKTYTITKLLGESNGHVYSATQANGPPVAIKRVFLDRDTGPVEKRALNKLKELDPHPFLVGVHKWFPIRKANELAIVMDKGDPLVSSQCTNLEFAQALRFVKGIAEALDYLHEEGIAHLDVKPANLVLFGGRTVKLGDYGAIREIQETQENSVPVSCLLCTPDYAAPELQQRRFSGKSDQFSLAVTYIELRTGGRSLSGCLSSGERKVLQKALAENPEDRWEKCRKFVEELERSAAIKPRTMRRPKREVDPKRSITPLAAKRVKTIRVSVTFAPDFDLLDYLAKNEANVARRLANTAFDTLRPGDVVGIERRFRLFPVDKAIKLEVHPDAWNHQGTYASLMATDPPRGGFEYSAVGGKYRPLQLRFGLEADNVLCVKLFDEQTKCRLELSIKLMENQPSDRMAES